MSQVQKEMVSLKIVNDSLNETELSLIDIEKKLDYVVHGESPQNSDAVKPVVFNHGSLDSISQRMYSIARLTSTISKLTNTISGN